jgi:hypothetical protein
VGQPCPGLYYSTPSELSDGALRADWGNGLLGGFKADVAQIQEEEGRWEAANMTLLWCRGMVFSFGFYKYNAPTALRRPAKPVGVKQRPRAATKNNILA